MSLSAQRDRTDEEAALSMTARSADTAETLSRNVSVRVDPCCGRRAASCCRDKHHRKLAISSIVCGLSCCGIKALIYSVKASMEPDPERSKYFSHKAKKYGIISIAVWVCLLVCAPMFLALASYLITLKD